MRRRWGLFWIGGVGLAVQASAAAATASGDFDNDGDVDSTDLARMVACRSGSGVPDNGTPNCQAADFDFDGDVDMDDFGVFQRCYSGAGIAANPNCARDTALVKNGTLMVNGSGASTKITLRLRSGVPTLLDIDFGDDGTADLTFDRSTFDHIVVHGGGGDDTIRIDETNGIFTDTEITTLLGDDGNDTLLGGTVAETFFGGRGNDNINPKRGNDIVDMGEDDDTFTWNPGDGNDVIEGRAGHDVMQFNGANVNENIDLSANGSRLRFTRDVAAIVMDVDGVEQVNFGALGGADTITVNNLAGTAVTQVNIDLGAISGGSGGDGAADTIVVNGTAAADTINVSGSGGATVVSGLTAGVSVTNGESALDRVLINGLGGDLVNVNGTDLADTMNYLPSGATGTLRVTSSSFSMPVDLVGSLSLSVNGLGGPDTITGSGGVAALLIPVQVDGGDGDDTLLGSNAAEIFIGGNGNDFIDGNQGNDTALMGEDADTFNWDPGDGSDIVEGQGGQDVLQMNLANVNENIDLSGVGGRLRLTRDVANITLDVDGVEQVNLPPLGGTDHITVNSLAGTAVTLVNIDLGATGGAGDASADSVTINGTAAADAFNLTTFAGIVSVSGVVPFVNVIHAEPTLDSLIINGLGGTDTFAVGPGVTSAILLTTNQ